MDKQKELNEMLRTIMEPEGASSHKQALKEIEAQKEARPGVLLKRAKERIEYLEGLLDHYTDEHRREQPEGEKVDGN